MLTAVTGLVFMSSDFLSGFFVILMIYFVKFVPFLHFVSKMSLKESILNIYIAALNSLRQSCFIPEAL